ncbi:3-oxoadipate enol-lactonase [Neobacillus sp. B4I6]|uniref:alpha/beta fold hydrolase n=1 Tax=Neobacillus sp. B4I6 TaxID=3373925 RepID=UPI003D20DB50
MPFLKTDKESLFYHNQTENLNTTGTHEGIVFLHSLGTDHQMWKYQLEDLDGKGRLLIAPDARGHGKSTRYTGISLDLWVNDILQLIDFLGLQRIIICGVSMGGVQALAFAQRYPNRVSGLVLADTFARIEPEAVHEKIRLTAGIAKELGMEKYANQYLDQTLSFSNTAQAIRETMRHSIAEMETGAYQKSAKACFSASLDSGLKNINIPTLVLIGENDQKTPLPYSQVIAESISDSNLMVVPRACHLANVDQPKEFNHLLKEFLSTLEN